MTTVCSPELMAQLAMPKGVERFRVTDREAWLRMRGRDFTASIIGSLVGAHEYTSAFEQWALKSGKIRPDIEETAAMERGTLLEPVAVELIRRRHPDWIVLYPVAWYYREIANRIGATPDVFVIDPSRKGFGNYQVKSVEKSVFYSKWREDDGAISPPLWIGLQTTTEATLTGASWSMVGALVVGHGLDLHETEVPIHHGVMTRLRRESLAMWARIERDDPPPVTDYERDGDTVRLLHPHADERLMKDLRGDNAIPALLARRLELQAREADGRAATIERRGIDARLIHTLQDAAYGSIGDGRVISAKVRRVAGKKPSRVITIEGDRSRRAKAVATNPSFDEPF